MLSVIVATHNHEIALARTLASLVPASMDGVVADVVVADAASHDETHRVADAAGCEFIVADAPRGTLLMRAAAQARCRWLLFLEPGVVLEQGWSDEALLFLRSTSMSKSGEQRSATFRAARPAYSAPGWRDAWLRVRQNALTASLFRPKPHQGLIISKAHYLKLGGHHAEKPHPEIDFLARLGRGACVQLNAKAFAPEY